MNKLSRAWDRWWFAPQTPIDLAVCRILFFGLCLYFFAQRNYSGFADVPTSFIDRVWIFQKLHLPVFGNPTLGVMEVVWKLSLAAACVGLLTRASTVVAALGTFYFAGLPFNFGKTDHNMAAVIFLAGILAISRSGDALSLDRLLLLWWRRGRSGPPVPPVAPSGEYRWPIRLAWCLMSVILFAAGATKLLVSGTSWVFSDNFAILLAQRHYGGTLPMVDWGLAIAATPWLARLFAAQAIAVELLFPLALIDRRARFIFPAAMFAMQLGIGVLMNVWFGPFMYSYVFWVPWSALLARFGAPSTSRERSAAANDLGPRVGLSPVGDVRAER